MPSPAFANPFLDRASPSYAPAVLPGRGRVVAALDPTLTTTLPHVSFRYPLKLLRPPSAAAAPITRRRRDTDTPTLPTQNSSALLYTLSYGGGLVAGDQVAIDMTLRPGARLSLATQGYTKIFAPAADTPEGNTGHSHSAAEHPSSGKSAPLSSSESTSQTLTVTLGPGAALCLLPDPVQPYADSLYEQTQRFYLSRAEDPTGGPFSSSICVLDWVTQGRLALGEDWSFARWAGRNEVWAGLPEPTTSSPSDSASKTPSPGNPVPTTPSPGDPLPTSSGDTWPPPPSLVLRDAIVLAAHDAVAQAPLRERMHGLGVFSTLILCGPLMAPVGDFFLAEFAALPRVGARDFRTPAEVAADLAKAPLSPQDDGPAWRARRVAAEKTDGIIWSAARVRAGAVVVVKFGAPVPEAARRWVGGMLVRQGGVRAVFGEHALLCVV